MIPATNGVGHAGAPFNQTSMNQLSSVFCAVTFLNATFLDWIFYSPESRNLSKSLTLFVEGQDLRVHASHPPIAIGRGTISPSSSGDAGFRAAAIMPKSFDVVPYTRALMHARVTVLKRMAHTLAVLDGTGVATIGRVVDAVVVFSPVSAMVVMLSQAFAAVAMLSPALDVMSGQVFAAVVTPSPVFAVMSSQVFNVRLRLRIRR